MGFPYLLLAVVAGTSPGEEPAEDLASARADFERDLVEVVATTALDDLTFVADRTGTWAAFGAPGQRSLCLEAAPRPGCVRLAAQERPTEALDDARRRLTFGDVAPPPRGVTRLFEVLGRASSLRPAGDARVQESISFLPLQLAEGRTLKLAGTADPAALLRVLTIEPNSACRWALPARGGGWAVMDARLERDVYAVGLAPGVVPDREVLLGVAGFSGDGSGMAGGNATLTMATFDGQRAFHLVGQKPVGFWAAYGKGWSLSGPGEQAWLWPSVTHGRVRLQRSPAPTRWLQRGSQRFATPSPKADEERNQRLAAIAAEEGDWCWDGAAFARCAPGK